ncbi:MAG: gamma subclass chorismate mutase AroQ [Pseudomonadales bacterium]
MQTTAFRLLLTLLLVSSPAAAAADRSAELINQRLELMASVAAFKWLKQRPIEDLAREQVVLDQAALQALRRQITTDSSRRFFAAQIKAAKQIQACWFDRWRNGDAPTAAPDLNTEVRPELLRLGTAIVDSLVTGTSDRAAFMQALDVDCLADSARSDIYLALTAIETYPSRLAQIRQSGILRVGTTGDYAPFSYARDEREPVGIDITLAKRLATQLGTKLHFVTTSWPTLSEDFLAGQFDIAMSGVSITAARQQIAAFSLPYHIGGKTPITLCRRADEFSSLALIDRPSNTLIVNPGGTNEKYLDAHIRQARKHLHNDNRTIFEEIIAGRADLMITDSIEVRLKSAVFPELCPSMPGRTLTYQEKGYMLPQEPLLVEAVNTWLKAEIDSGELERVFASHLQARH